MANIHGSGSGTSNLILVGLGGLSSVVTRCIAWCTSVNLLFSTFLFLSLAIDSTLLSCRLSFCRLERRCAYRLVVAIFIDAVCVAVIEILVVFDASDVVFCFLCTYCTRNWRCRRRFCSRNRCCCCYFQQCCLYSWHFCRYYCLCCRHSRRCCWQLFTSSPSKGIFICRLRSWQSIHLLGSSLGSS